MRLRRAVLAALCTVVLISVGPAAAATALDGAYRTTVGGSGLLSGTWTIRFDPTAPATRSRSTGSGRSPGASPSRGTG